MAVDGSERRTRRALLGAAVAGVGALAVEAVARPSGVSAVGTPVLLGESNYASSPTSIEVGTGDAVMASTDGQGNTALFGSSGNGTSGHGVYGEAYGTTDDAVGVWGRAWGGGGSVAVQGTNRDLAHNPAGLGVFGDGTTGVQGNGSDVGVSGWSVNGSGVYGFSAHSVAGTFETADATATALATAVGRVVIGGGRSGRIKVAAGKASGYRAITGVTSGSFVVATLAASRTGVWVRAAVATSGKVTVYLSKAVSTTTYVNYLVLN